MHSDRKNFGGRLWKAVDKVGKLFSKAPFIFTACTAVIVVLIVEMLSRHSVWQGFVFLFTHPVRYITNVMIVLATLSLSFLFKKRSFFVVLISVVWLAFGIVNFTILGYRPTPFGIIDIQLLPSVFTIINMYMDSWQIILLIVGAAAVIAGLAFLLMKVPSAKIVWKKTLIFIAVSFALASGLFLLVASTGNYAESMDDNTDIAKAYRDYGFAYCFCTGVVDKGIDEPEEYSKENVDRVVDSLGDVSEPQLKPDIIMVQLESFFDVGYLDDVTYSENPTPVFTSLKEEYSTGFLTVPSVGAGTANTEFEVLSGMSLGFFGMGEYPYKTILKEQACETVATDLAQIGYASHAIHNNTGTFYDRNTVFAQLGFDTFTSIEYMQDVEYNPIGWAKDSVLTGEILAALDSTPGQDLVFTITVQGHGKYQRGEDTDEAEMEDTTWEEDPDDGRAFAFYISQLRETDQFIGELIDALEERGEPAVLVLYGDHLPNFSIGSEQLENGDVFETEYVIWDNLGLEKEDRDLHAYQLSSWVMERLGISQGILCRYHQQWDGSESDDYWYGLGLLEYDMLYGEFYCYGGTNPYTASNISMGVKPITIENIRVEEDGVYITGNNFTEFSVVAFDSELQDTEYIDGDTLFVEGEPPDDGMYVSVAQVTDRAIVLSESDGIIYKEKTE